MQELVMSLLMLDLFLASGSILLLHLEKWVILLPFQGNYTVIAVKLNTKSVIGFKIHFAYR